MTGSQLELGDGKAKKAVTAADIRGGLRTRWGGGDASCLCFEVAQGTGTNANRHLDAVAMELWPSRGLALHGIEIKVSKSDLKRELETPQKAEEIARFLDYFWIATPVGLADIGALPSAWGLLEWNGTALRTVKPAHKTESQPLTRHFMAAMLRASFKRSPTENDEILQRMMREQDERFQRRVQEASDARASRRSEDEKNWQKLTNELGVPPEKYVFGPEVIHAVKFVMQSKLHENWRGLGAITKLMREYVERVEAAAKTAGIPLDDK